MAYKRKVSYTQGARRVRRGKKRAEKTKIGEKGGGREWRKKTPSASVGGAEES